MPKIWSLITGADDVNLYFDEASRDAAIVEAIRGYKDNPEDFEEEAREELRAENPDDTGLIEVTIDNWRDVLRRLNDEMDMNGEAHYLCELKEHEVDLRLAVILRDGAVEGVQSTSALLQGTEVAIAQADFDPAVADEQLIDTPTGKVMITRETVAQADIDLDAAYALDAEAARPGPRI